MSRHLTQFFIIPTLIVALAISLLLLARSVWRIVFGAKSVWVEGICIALLVAAASFITIDMIQESRVSSFGILHVYVDFSCLLFFLAIISYAYRFGTFSGAAKHLRKNAHSWMMIAIAVAMTGWCYHRIDVRSKDYGLVGLEVPLPGNVEVQSDSFALTDEGTVVPLYSLDVTDEMFEEYVQSSHDKFRDYNHAGIRRENADRMANCHGWVFTGGKYLLKGRDVDFILCDNQYSLVKDPQPNDVVIYRDDNRQILHTALVQSVLRDGTVITESKWGIDQRFIHLPDDQPYSQFYEYYRTNRPNHLIRILDSTTPDPDLNDG